MRLPELAQIFFNRCRAMRWATAAGLFHGLRMASTLAAGPLADLPEQLPPQLASVGFATSQFDAQENMGTLLVPVQRRGDTNSIVTVDYTTADESATAGEDYVAQHGTLFFAPGEILKNITVPILNDGHNEQTDSFQISLSVTSAAPILEPFALTHVFIADNDSGVGFLVARAGVEEGSGVAEMLVQRGDDWPGAITVDYDMAKGTATAGRDYVASHGTLHFAAGETLKSITIPILEDRIIEATETLEISLSGLSPEVSYGTKTNLTLYIADNDIVRPQPTRRRHLLAAASGLYAIKLDGSLWTWGANYSGELGIGPWAGGDTPRRVDLDFDWVEIYAGRGISLASKADGSLWAWGWLGESNAYVPKQIGSEYDWATPAPSASSVDQTIVVTDHWRDSQGTFQFAFTHTNHRAYYVLYRGSNVTTIQQPVGATLAGRRPLLITDPTPPTGPGSTFYRIKAHPVLDPIDLDADGLNDVYELQHADVIDPFQAADATADSDGDGRSNRREFADGTNPAGAEHWSVATAGLNHSLVLKSDRSLWAWGLNQSGQLGDGTHENRSAPVRIGSDQNWASVSTSHNAFEMDHTVGLKLDGTLWAWGNNYTGQLGIGTNTQTSDVPIQISPAPYWASIAAGDSYTLAIHRDGTLWGCGRSRTTGLNLGPDLRRVPGPLPGIFLEDTDWSAVAAGAGHALALKTNGTLWAWGDNVLGQCAQLQGDVIDEWTQIGTNTGWIAIAASGDGDWFDGSHSLAVKADGTLWAWGGNSFGECGFNSEEAPVRIPTRVGSGTNWIDISAGCGRSLARQRDGTLWAWGSGFGDRPVQVDPGHDWRFFAAGGPSYDSFFFAIKDDGTLWTTPAPGLTPARFGHETTWGFPP